jgi:hypothetical protein
MKIGFRIVFIIIGACVYSLNSYAQERSIFGTYIPPFKKNNNIIFFPYTLEIKKDSSFEITIRSCLTEMCSFGKIKINHDSLELKSAFNDNCKNDLIVEEIDDNQFSEKVKIIFRTESRIYNNAIIPLSLEIDTLIITIKSLNDTVIVDKDLLQRYPLFINHYLIAPFTEVCFNGYMLKYLNADLICINLPRTCNCSRYDFSDNEIFMIRRNSLIKNGVKFKRYYSSKSVVQ